MKRLCFNFSEGKRILVYVRKDATTATSNDMSYGENIENGKQFEKELHKIIIDIRKIYIQTQKKEEEKRQDKTIIVGKKNIKYKTYT